MSQDKRLTPNTHLGEVHWYCDEFFGTLLFVCQEMLGMYDRGPNQYNHNNFLDTKRHSVEGLREYFDEIKLENGNLGLELLADDMYRTCVLAKIETTLSYDAEVSDQTFLHLIDDFVEYVRSLPLVDPDKREGALWTDEDIERGYSEAANRLHAEAWRQVDEILSKAYENPQTPPETEEQEKE